MLSIIRRLLAFPATLNRGTSRSLVSSLLQGVSPTPEETRKALADQILVVLRTSPQNLGAGIVAAFLLAATLWWSAPSPRGSFQWTPWVWFVLLSMGLLRGIKMSAPFRQRPHSVDETIHQGHLLLLNGVYCAVIWGSSSWLMLPHPNQQAEVFLVVSIAMVLMGGSASQGLYRPFLLAFLFPTTAIFVAGCLFRVDDWMIRLLASVFPLLAFVILAATLTQEDALKAAILLRLKTENLLQEQIHLQEMTEKARKDAELARADAEGAKFEAEKRLQQYYSTQKAALQEITELRQVAEEERKRRLQFIRDMLHDIKGPLSAVGTNIDTYRHAKRAGLDDVAQAAATQMVKAYSVVSMLTRDLFELSSYELRLQAIHTTAIKVSEILENVADSFRDAAHEKGIEIRIFLRSTDLYCLSDDSLLHRIIVNLVANAVKFTPPRPPGVSGVVLGATAKSGYVEFLVWDTGVGIPAERQAEIWEYGKTTNGTNNEKGYGIGLTLTQAMCKSLPDHDLIVRPRKGLGARFAVRVPIGFLSSS